MLRVEGKVVGVQRFGKVTKVSVLTNGGAQPGLYTVTDFKGEVVPGDDGAVSLFVEPQVYRNEVALIYRGQEPLAAKPSASGKV